MASSVKLSDVVPSRFAHLTPTDPANVERIRLDLVEGSKILLNVPHVFKNEAGKYELLAGHDRTEAWRLARPNEPLPVRDFSGTVNSDDAILAHFCRENLLRKDISKAAIAGEWLRKHPDWSDGKIAAESGCTAPHVGEVRAQLVATGDIKPVTTRIGLDGRKTESKREPRQPKRGPLGKPKHTPAKPKSTDDVAAEMLARAEAMRKANEGRAERRAPEAGHIQGASTGAAMGVELGTPSEVGAPTGATASEGPEANSANSAINAGGVLDPSKSTRETEGLEAPEQPVEPQLPAADVPPATSAVRGGGRGRALAVLDSLGVLPDHDDPDTIAGLTSADRKRFMALSSWAIRMAGKCPNESSQEAA